MRLTSILAFAFAATLTAGCGSSAPKDADQVASVTVPVVPTDFEVQDSIDGDKDKVDFKILRAAQSGTATVKIVFSPDHKVAGSIGVLAADATTNLQARLVSPGLPSYELKFDVSAGDSYYLKVASNSGASSYSVFYSISKAEPADPCANVTCDDEQECKNGECVDVEPAVCEPRCRNNLVCVDGECVKPCGGACPRGQICSRSRNECVKDPCAGKTCGDGERCVSGTCREVASTKKECTPACSGGQTCNTSTGKCEGGTTAPPGNDECSGPLNAKVVQVVPVNDKSSLIVLSGGTRQCVKVGMTGSLVGVNGGNFKITEVYDFRSKAQVNLGEAAIGSGRSAVIKR